MHRVRARFHSLTAFLAGGLIAATLALTASAEGSPQTVRLKYRENAYYVPDLQHRTSMTVKFKKEPPFGNDQVYRNAFGRAGDTKDYIGFAWDATTKKLYLDLNQNLDLTDDPPISPTVRTTSGSFILDDVRFVMPGPVPRPYQMTITGYTYGDTTAYMFETRSGWEGQVQLGGEQWTLAVIGNFDGAINAQDTLLVYRNRGYTTAPKLLHSIYGMRAEPELRIGDRAYELTYKFVPAGDACELEVTLREKLVSCGELEITGAHIERVNLRGAHDVALDAPHGVMKVPVGDYNTEEVYVYDSDTSRCFTTTVQKIVRVAEGARAVLKAGAPLENKIDVVRDGMLLNLSYTLTDMSGDSYRPVNATDLQDLYAHPPEFEVHKGTRTVAVGQFAYG